MFSRLPAVIAISLAVFYCQSAPGVDSGSGLQAPECCSDCCLDCSDDCSGCAACASGGCDISSILSNWLNGRYWPAFTSWEIKAGNRRVLGDGLLMVPLVQDSHSMLFADVRAQTDDNDSREGNWGLGLRRIVNDSYIVGLYGFYDLRYSASQNYFSQGMMGMEMLGVEWEARVNGYLPDTGAKPANTTAGMVGNNIFVFGDWERAYYGVEAEVGHLLRCWGDNADVELRGYVGGFHFDNNAAGFPNVSGPNARLELRGYDLNLFGQGSRLALGCEVTWDQVRDAQVFGFVRIGIPIGPGRHRVGRLSRLRRRMLDRIERDVDVITYYRNTGPELALYGDTGLPPGNVTVVDATTADVPATVAGAGPNSTVIADGTKGRIDVGSEIILQNGQTVRGGGFGVVGQDTGLPAVFGTRPTVNGTNPANNVFRIVDNATVRGMDITGGSSAIHGNTVTGFIIRDNYVFDTNWNGITFSNTNSGDIIGNTVANTPGTGIWVNTFQGGTISGNRCVDNYDNGLSIWHLQGGTVSDNTSSGNSPSANGLSFLTISGGNVTGNTASNNSQHGFYIGDLSGGNVSGNTSTGNTFDGFEVPQLQGTAQFNNNRSADNGGQGYDVTVTGGTPTATNNTGQNNTGGNNTYTYP